MQQFLRIVMILGVLLAITNQTQAGDWYWQPNVRQVHPQVIVQQSHWQRQVVTVQSWNQRIVHQQPFVRQVHVSPFQQNVRWSSWGGWNNRWCR